MDKADSIKEELTALFDEMLMNRKKFKKKLYSDAVEEARQAYAGTINSIITCLQDAEGTDKDELLNELADAIPKHAYDKIQGVKKINREKYAVDYNLNMAAYVVPVLNYTRNEDCMALTQKMVERWNERKVTPLTLSHSTYEDIASGFDRKLCYITTAVCQSQGKPDDCYELSAFRGFRDDCLMQSEEGRELVEEYYDIAPGIVMTINMERHPEKIYDSIYERYLLPCLAFIEAGKKDECKKKYMSMVRELEKNYLDS